MHGDHYCGDRGLFRKCAPRVCSRGSIGEGSRSLRCSDGNSRLGRLPPGHQLKLRFSTTPAGVSISR